LTSVVARSRRRSSQAHVQQAVMIARPPWQRGQNAPIPTSPVTINIERRDDPAAA
jgi:hypothetical protein